MSLLKKSNVNYKGKQTRGYIIIVLASFLVFVLMRYITNLEKAQSDENLVSDNISDFEESIILTADGDTIYIFYPNGIELCSHTILNDISKNIDSLDYMDIYDFFSTFKESCKVNVEFFEWYNELLFTILEDYPAESMGVLVENESIPKSSILRMIESPIHDNIEIDKIIDSFNEVFIFSDLKQEFLNSLEVARIKRNTH